MESDPKDGSAATAPTVAADSSAATLATRAAPTGEPGTLPPSWPSSSGADPGAPGLARYRLGAVLGRGGMGEVVSARDEQIGRSVAIKRMRAAAPSADTTARFIREAKIQGRLDHPAVVPVHELWRDDQGQPFFVMKQLTGVTLADVLASNDPELTKKYSRQRLLRAFCEVCLAVEFAHTHAIVHRDLKPANIVLGDFGEVYVIDWGIARVAGDEAMRASFGDVVPLDDTGTVAGSILGTPGYMSPEQIRGDADLDGRSDVYALGCILFEILTAAALHPRGHAALASTLEGVDAKPSTRAPDREIAPELDAICLAATMLDRADRYATARDLGDAVQQFLDGDRDLELRKDLARAALETARAALARGTGTAERTTALRAAARALALDPKAREPAELVGMLMLEPPAEVPPEVEREIETLEEAAMKSQARLSAFAIAGYFVFFPLLYWAGWREAWYLIAGPVLVTVLFGFALLLTRHSTAAIGWTTFGLNLLVILLLSRVMTPFLVAPGLALISAMIYAMHPIYRRVWIVALGSLAAVFAPLVAELTGLTSRTTRTIGPDIVFHTPTNHLDETVTMVGLVLFVTAIVVMAVLIARSLASNRTTIQRRLFLQAWQLRQLVPRSQTAAD